MPNHTYTAVRQILIRDPVQKSDFFLFDHVIVPWFDAAVVPLPRSARKRMDWLRSKGLVSSGNPIAGIDAGTSFWDESDPLHLIALCGLAFAVVSEMAQSILTPEDGRHLNKISASAWLSCGMRAYACELERSSGIRTTAVLPNIPLLDDTLVEEITSPRTRAILKRVLSASFPGAGKRDPRHAARMLVDKKIIDNLQSFRTGVTASPVTHVLLRALPQPAPSTPWEAIIEFAQDENLKLQRFELRRWMHRVASTEATEAEIMEELEYQIACFEDHLRVHGLKSHRGRFEGIICGLAEFAEHAIQKRYGEAAKMLFSARSTRAETLVAERQAPGRELAYISAVRKKFGSP